MKIVSNLLSGQYLSTAYDFYASKASLDFDTMDPNMVGTSMASANNIYCGHLAIDGSWNVYMGSLPDHLWGVVWRTPTSALGLSVTSGGVKPETVYTLLLDDNGVLNVQASGTTLWKSDGPSEGLAGPYFATIGDDGAMTLSTGTPVEPGTAYWTSKTDNYTLIIQRTAGFGHTQLQLNVTYRDTSNGRPGQLKVNDIGNTATSRTVQWPAMLAAPTDPNYLQSLPAAMSLVIDPYGSPQVVDLGVCRAITMSVTDSGCSFPLGIGVIAGA